MADNCGVWSIEYVTSREHKAFSFFGARGVGKSTHLKQHFANHKKIYFIDLLDPKIQNLKTDADKTDFFRILLFNLFKRRNYLRTDHSKSRSFSKFLDIAAQMSGHILNFSKIVRDLGIDTSTVQNYFSILEDTLIGFSLPAFHHSIRKRQRQAPKFYLILESSAL